MRAETGFDVLIVDGEPVKGNRFNQPGLTTSPGLSTR